MHIHIIPDGGNRIGNFDKLHCAILIHRSRGGQDPIIGNGENTSSGGISGNTPGCVTQLIV